MSSDLPGFGQFLTDEGDDGTCVDHIREILEGEAT